MNLHALIKGYLAQRFVDRCWKVDRGLRKGPDSTGEGRKRAMSKGGVRFGRKPKLSDYQRDEAIKRRAAGEALADIAKSYGVHLSMISRL